MLLKVVLLVLLLLRVLSPLSRHTLDLFYLILSISQKTDIILSQAKPGKAESFHTSRSVSEIHAFFQLRLSVA